MNFKNTRYSAATLISALGLLMCSSSALAFQLSTAVTKTTDSNTLVISPGVPLPPDTSSPKPIAPYITNIDRKENMLTIKWNHPSTDEDYFKIYRREADGILAAVGDSVATDTWMLWDDEDIAADTRYCYRLRAVNSYGVSAYSNEVCAYTKDGINNPVWRVELELHTASVDHANTSNSVQVRLNSPLSSYRPRNNNTWLDYGRDDFEKSTVYTYDLNLSSIEQMEDITMISLTKTGTDGWCLKGVKLKVNGLDVYSRDINMETGSCQWIDGDDGHKPIYTIWHDELRAHPSWMNYNEIAAALLAAGGLPNEEMVSRIEGIVGDQLHYQDAYWGDIQGDAVEVSRGCDASFTSCQKLHVTLDLKADAAWGIIPIPDPRVDLAFDLNFECQNDNFVISSEAISADVDSSWYWELLSAGFINILDILVGEKIESSWTEISESIGIQACPEVNIDEQGNVNFTLPTERFSTQRTLKAPSTMTRISR